MSKPPDFLPIRRGGEDPRAISICRYPVTLLGGEIRAESEFGKGSQFGLTLSLTRGGP